MMRFNATFFVDEQRRGDCLSYYNARVTLNPVTEYISLPNSRQTSDNDRICPARHTASGVLFFSLFLLPLFLFLSLFFRFVTPLPKYISRTGSQLDCTHTALSILYQRIKTDFGNRNNVLFFFLFFISLNLFYGCYSLF